MNTERIIGIGIIILLLYLLFKKSMSEQAVSATDTAGFVLDPTTGIRIGYHGVRDDPLTIGPVLLPPNVPNDVDNSQFQKAAKSSTVPFCPSGYSAIIDPDKNAAYCIIDGYGSVSRV